MTDADEQVDGEASPVGAVSYSACGRRSYRWRRVLKNVAIVVAVFAFFFFIGFNTGKHSHDEFCRQCFAYARRTMDGL